MKRVAVLACSALVASTATVLLVPGGPAAAATSDVIDVVSVTGSTSAASAVSVVPMTANASSASAGTGIALPSAKNGANNALTLSGSAGSEGQLSLSGDGNYLTLGGYAAASGTASVSSTASTAVQRVVGRIDAAGNVDTTTLLGTDAFSGNNIRSATTNDGSRFWVTGNNTKTSGIVATAALGATTSTSVSTAATNGRAVHAAGGNLYVSSDKTTAYGTFRVGSGLPTASGQTLTQLTSSGTTVAPNDFAVLTLGSGSSPDTVYVAEQTGGIDKYSLLGGSWTKTGSAGSGGYFGLAARSENGGVQLYATTADNTKLVSLFDASGAGGTLTAGPTTISTAGSGTSYRGVAFGPTGQAAPGPKPSLVTSDPVLGGVVGDAGNPTLGVTLSDPDGSVDLGSVTVTATSSNPGVAASSGVTVNGAGASRTVSVTPAGAVGYSTITLTATDPLGRSGSTTFQYGASAAADDTTSRWLDGASDSSSAVDVGNGYILVADDSTNVLRLFHSDRSGPAVRQWDLNTTFGLSATKGSDSLDLEAAARVGDTVYWTGSMTNSSTAPYPARPTRSSLFATTLTGTGADTQLTVTGVRYTGLRQDLLAWDAANNDALGLNASATDGHDPKTIDGLNVEGMEFAADGRTAYLGFRAPLENPADRTKALVVPVTNLPDLTSGAATKATFGTPMLWDLGGLAIREIRRNAHNQYLIIGGSYEGGSSTYRLYTWNGDPSSAPVGATTAVPAPRGGWESIVATPDPITSGSPVQLIEDDGAVDFYGDGQQSKDLALGLRKSRIDTLALTLPTQQLAFTSTPPAKPGYGDSYTAAVTGGPSGLPVTVTAAGGCTLGPVTPGTDSHGNATASATVTYTDVTPCVLTANQDGGTSYQAAAPISQTSTAGKASPTITWATPDHVTYGTRLGSTQLNATTTVAGTFTYDPPAGTVLGAGQNTLSVTFTPTDTAHYSTSTASVTLTVDKATQKIDFPTPADRTFGDGPVALQATGGASSAPVTYAASGQCTLDTTTVTITGAGSCTVTASQAGDPNFNAAADVTRTFTIARATPAIAWASPASITYGTTLGATQLAAAASLNSTAVDGSFVYTLDDGTTNPSGTTPTAGAHTLPVTFTPTDTADYTVATASVPLTVTKATPALAWTPSTTSLTYGDALTGEELNATSSVPGSFVYDRPAGTVLHASSGTVVTATFTPTDTVDYVGGSVSATFTVARAAQSLRIADPGTHHYGDAPFTVTATGGHSGSPVTLTAAGPCTVGATTSTGDPVVGSATVTITGAGDCRISAHQDGSADYLPAQDVTTSVTIDKSTPTITWPTPDPITYGTAVGSAQLDATASVPGRFAYTLDDGTADAAGAKPSAGSHTLHVAFTPTDTADYDGTVASVTLTVGRATPTLAWATPAGIGYGTALGATQLNATASVPGTFAYTLDDGTTNPSGTKPTAGTHTLHVTFTPTDAADYTAATASVTLAVAKATPAISWTPDAALTYGDTVSGGQLDAVGSVPGAFTYTLDDGTADAAGAKPSAGTHTLHATFTPADAADYTSSTAAATITVAKASQTLTVADPGLRHYGDEPVTVSATGGRSGSPVTFTTTGPCSVSGAASAGDPEVGTATLTITGAGDCRLTAHQAGSGNYLPAQDVTQSVTVAKATPALTWPTPAAVTYGTTLGAEQFDATASVAGTFAYTVDGAPYSGAAPGAGTHTLGVTFTPSDAADYDPATASVTLTVRQATSTVELGTLTDRVVGAPAFAVPVTSSGSTAPVSLTASPASVCRVSGRTLTIAGVGTCTVTANLPGDANHTAAPSTSATFAVVYAARTTVQPSSTVKAGVPLTLYVQLLDAKGANVSAASIPVRVLGVDAAAGAKPGAGFRYLPAVRGYSYTLPTTGLRRGAHALDYVAGADPTRHTIAFTIR